MKTKSLLNAYERMSALKGNIVYEISNTGRHDDTEIEGLSRAIMDGIVVWLDETFEYVVQRDVEAGDM